MHLATRLSLNLYHTLEMNDTWCIIITSDNEELWFVQYEVLRLIYQSSFVEKKYIAEGMLGILYNNM